MNTILIIGTVWPEPNSTAAGQRIMQLVAIFTKFNYEIIFASAATKTEFSLNLEQLNIHSQSIELNSNSFDNLIKSIKPNIVLFDRFITEEQFGWRVSKTCPDAIKILDSEDLHFLREARKNCFKKNIPCTSIHLKNELAKREIAAFFRCDITLIISKFEYELLTHSFKLDPSLLHYIPMIYDEINESEFVNYPSFHERTDFFSIGNFLHQPNWDTVLELKNKFWPLIKKKNPQANLHIYGAYVTEKAKQLNNIKEGFIIQGRIQNSQDAFKKHRVLLAPLPYGAGIKGKLLESMRYGCPNVTTQIGSEAMHENLEWNGFVENNPTAFAEKATLLYSNENIWNHKQKNGTSIINLCFNKQNHEQNLVNTINNIHLDTHRMQNFFGQILNHHTLNSHKYMSKWIEEKNANKNNK